MLLNSTDTLQVVNTGSSPSIDYIVRYEAFTIASGLTAFFTAEGNISTATTTTIVPAPAAGTSYLITYLSFYNNNAGTQTLKVQKFNGSTAFTTTQTNQLQQFYSLIYDDQVGWGLHLDTGATLSQAAAGTAGAQGPQGPIGFALDGDDGADGISIAGPQGPQGIQGIPGQTGAAALPIALNGADGDDGMPIPGPQGPSGAPGGVGPTGPAGPAIYLEAPDADEPLAIPGASGPAGVAGSTGSQGPAGPAVYLEAQEADEPMIIPGPAGVAGSSGSTGAQGPSGPAVYLEAPDADEGLQFQGPAGSPGITGAQGPIGPSAHFTVDTTSEIDIASEALSAAGSAFFDPDTGAVKVAGGLSANTSIASTTTPTTGGITLTNQIAAAGSVWRVRAMGTFTAVSSATTRNALCAAFWGATSLVVLTVGAVLVSTAQTTNWDLEIILAGTSTTAVWSTGHCINQVASATALAHAQITPASTTVTAGAQTLDLRFYSSVVVASDSWTVQQVTIERLI